MQRDVILKEISVRLNDDYIDFVMRRNGALRFEYRFGSLGVSKRNNYLRVSANFYCNSYQSRHYFTIEEIEESWARSKNTSRIRNMLNPFKLFCCH